MNNPLQQFSFDDKNTLRVIADDDGNPLFCAKDVCAILGYSNDRDAIARHCKVTGVVKRDIGVVTGKTTNGFDAIQQVKMTFIDEGNLYRLIIKSNKPEAEPFESWVCDEVLPSIRKHGYYLPSTVVNNDSLNEVTGHLPFQRLNTAKFAELRKISKELAQAYLLECGITPDYVKSKIGLAGDYAAANIYGQPGAAHLETLVQGFVRDWQSGTLGVPFVHCQSNQAVRLFYHYANKQGVSVRHGDNHIIEALSDTAELYKKRIRLTKGQGANPKSIIMIHNLPTPNGQDLTRFVAHCVQQMEIALRHLA